MRRGTARAWDHAQLVHDQWMRLAILNCQVHVVRVATDDNIADLPSREDFSVLRAEGAQEVEPVLDTSCESCDTWAVLRERWQC